MAYMTKDGKGPYPNKKGEYCGNHFPNTSPDMLYPETLEQAEQHQRNWLKNKRFGRPHSCQAGTTKEMAARGWVGVYLAEDAPIYDGCTEIDTPPELMEPNE